VDIDATFLPSAVDLIDNVFPTSVQYLQVGAPVYDPATGDVTETVTQLNIKAGVLSRGRTEQGGVGEEYTLRLWIHHASSGLPDLPTTSDRVVYDGTTWSVVSVDPTYSSAGLIASRITARNQ
jgi:hypothetical protein